MCDLNFYRSINDLLIKARIEFFFIWNDKLQEASYFLLFFNLKQNMKSPASDKSIKLTVFLKVALIRVFFFFKLERDRNHLRKLNSIRVNLRILEEN